MAFRRHKGLNKAEFRLKIIKPHSFFMVAGMKRMQKCQYLPPHAAEKICPSLQALLPSSWGEGSLSQAPNTKEYTNKIKIIAGDVQKAKILVNGVSVGIEEQ